MHSNAQCGRSRHDGTGRHAAMDGRGRQTRNVSGESGWMEQWREEQHSRCLWSRYNSSFSSPSSACLATRWTWQKPQARAHWSRMKASFELHSPMVDQYSQLPRLLMSRHGGSSAISEPSEQRLHALRHDVAIKDGLRSHSPVADHPAQRWSASVQSSFMPSSCINR
mmetsp:Transcript_23182/g.72742  ORF Transcript_23182/g.72742 Transcript_23182/m.72742 type:complete len:167 (-) Transcript_23182:361-861(-)